MKRITVLLAEDHCMVREALRALLNLEEEIEVIGEAGNGRQSIDLALALEPSVVVMDIAMPLLNGLEATRQILRAAPHTRILILSGHSNPAYVAHVVSLGAAGYLTKQSAASVLPRAIREVHAGRGFFSPVIVQLLQHHRRRAELRGELSAARTEAPLTSRQTEVLQLIAEGKANKEAAAELQISIKTVEKHRQSLMEKLNIHDTAGLTRHAISAGLIESLGPLSFA